MMLRLPALIMRESQYGLRPETCRRKRIDNDYGYLGLDELSTKNNNYIERIYRTIRRPTMLNGL